MKLITLNSIQYKTKSKVSIFVDTVAMLPYTFVLAGVTKEEEWARSSETIVKRFKLNITEVNIDGRNKEFKNLPYFTWGILKTLKNK
jgi:hypothetical protein